MISTGKPQNLVCFINLLILFAIRLEFAM